MYVLKQVALTHDFLSSVSCVLVDLSVSASFRDFLFFLHMLVLIVSFFEKGKVIKEFIHSKFAKDYLE